MLKRKKKSNRFLSTGYIQTAKDGEDIAEKSRETRDRIHLPFFDVIMPKKNGEEAFDEVNYPVAETAGRLKIVCLFLVSFWPVQSKRLYAKTRFENLSPFTIPDKQEGFRSPIMSGSRRIGISAESTPS